MAAPPATRTGPFVLQAVSADVTSVAYCESLFQQHSRRPSASPRDPSLPSAFLHSNRQ
ncbi:hypothetical protein HPP92_016691 [Vanilla planifolia]|nr:hypothetical protein HPP92_016691 [Vanilla planifolia]